MFAEGSPPELAEHFTLPVEGKAAVARRAFSTLLTDQALRWAAGERLGVESYLQQIPDLAMSSATVVDLIASEFLLRRRLGEAPTAQEYVARFPEHAAIIKDRLDATEKALADATDSDCDPLLTVAISRSPLAPDDAATRSQVGRQPRVSTAGVPAIPGYEILEELGRGGMGVVYKARQVGLNRIVALKVILAGGHSSARERDRFRTEAEAIARLQHANIVQVYEIGEHDGLPFFSLEYCGNGNLSGQLDGNALEPTAAARR